MGFYAKYIFPWLMDFLCGNEKLSAYRKDLLKDIQGNVLEIGFGTGLNLPHYPKSVQALTILDPNAGMHRKAKQRIKLSGIKVDIHLLSCEKLPFKNQSFDTVVSTFTLCSIPDAELALWEIHRVLKKDGKLLFLEHGLSSDVKVQDQQRRWTPFEKRIADGCHLDRDMATLVGGAGFRFLQLKKFYHPGVPKMLGFFYQGSAQKVGGA